MDGSNIATEGRTLPSLAQLDEAIRTFLEEYPGFTTSDVTVVVDASFGHRIDPSEQSAFEQAIEHDEMITPPAGAIGRGDGFILRIAEKSGALVLSNDSFQEFHAERPWLFEPGRLIGGKPVPGVGWVFTPRTPVRGPRSRSVTSKSKRDAKVADELAAVDGGGEAGLDGEMAAGAGSTSRGAATKATRATRATRSAGSAEAGSEAEPARTTRSRRGATAIAPSEATDGTEASNVATPATAELTLKAAKATKAAKSTKAAKATKATKAAKATKATRTTKASEATTAVKATRTAKAGKAADAAAAGGTGETTRSTKATKAIKATKATKATKASRGGAPSPTVEGDGASTRRTRASSNRAADGGDGRPGPAAEALNDPMTFLTFVADHPVGSNFDGTVVSFTSHGAHIDVGGMLCHVPLRRLADPPPQKARQVLTKGETRPFVLLSLDAARRRAELGVPGVGE